MVLSLTPALVRSTALASWAQCAVRLPVLPVIVWQFSDKKGSIYNILWVLVFGFATLNILSLVAKRFEPSRTRLSFGEMLAIMVVLVSVFLLGSEMLYLFKVFPIKLKPR
jgi:hypothetical protein